MNIYNTNPLFYAFQEQIKEINRKTEKKQLKKRDLKFSPFDRNHLVYIKLLEQTYRDQFSRQDISDFKYKIEDSDEYLGVFRNDKINQIVLSFKGTTTIGEIEQDLYLTIGQLPRRVFKGLLEKVNMISMKYPGMNIFLIGHSLGGTKVMFISSKTGYTGIAFNPFLPRVDETGIDIIYKTPNMIKYVNYGDRLSNNIIKFKDVSNLKILYNTGLGTIANHALSSFYNSQ